jgi:hypothetical protein
MAMTAADSAAYDAAMPIATADANVNASAAQVNAGAANAASLANLQANTAKYATDTGAATAKYNVDTSTAAALNVANTEASYKGLTQASASATTIMNNSTNQINQILQNESITGDSTTEDPANPGKFISAKQLAIDQINANTTKSLQMVGALAGDVDLASFMNSVLG